MGMEDGGGVVEIWDARTHLHGEVMFCMPLRLFAL